LAATTTMIAPAKMIPKIISSGTAQLMIDESPI
jgi:hypothetical protein